LSDLLLDPSTRLGRGAAEKISDLIRIAVEITMLLPTAKAEGEKGEKMTCKRADLAE